jgi:hypothetical protein
VARRKLLSHGTGAGRRAAIRSTGAMLPPEGNGHQAEFSLNSNYIVAAD